MVGTESGRDRVLRTRAARVMSASQHLALPWPRYVTWSQSGWLPVAMIHAPIETEEEHHHDFSKCRSSGSRDSNRCGPWTAEPGFRRTTDCLGMDWDHSHRHIADRMVSRIHPDGDSHLQGEGDILTGLLTFRLVPATGTNRIYCSLIFRSPDVIDIDELIRIHE